ncbi:glycosyl transferase [Bacillus methanolicus]|uniref:glycosyltransferase n=1 Tax=Bacillus methanolicus TaxID=1471 RepID=UPI00237FF61E|nr:glycosyltransferase [Bacillus methanolicus]MDE3840171.1 glycosyl transferase [Bacillus methanolicus]
MRSVLLYYPFQIAENANSGSKLRPKEIYNAFLEWGNQQGIEILLLSGSSEDRDQQFERWKKQGKLDDLLFCYMENQTIPLWLTDANHIPKKPFVDLKVMKFLKQRNIPVGVFYRDVYWKFDELYPLKGVKKHIMKTIYRLEEKFYEKYCHVIFLPSEAMGNFVEINRKKVALPPGGRKREIVRNQSSGQTGKGIYVGGINNEDYGLFLLLDALEIVNKERQVCDLTVVCRQDEYEKLPDNKKERLKHLKVTVKHISGEALNKLYQEMDFAFIPRIKSTYNDFSVPVKLVEYLSNELPVVATNCAAQEEIINRDGFGVICKDEPNSMAEAILTMIKNAEIYRENIKELFIEKHSWAARVAKVASVLLKEEI